MKHILFILAMGIGMPAICADLVLGSPAPQITARLLDSSTMVEPAAKRGKVTIINFWATWCGPCKAEMPALQAYYDKHKDQGLEILAISMDDVRDLTEVRKVASKFTFPIALKSEAN